jgi:hypothetical protein
MKEMIKNAGDRKQHGHYQHIYSPLFYFVPVSGTVICELTGKIFPYTNAT